MDNRIHSNLRALPQLGTAPVASITPQARQLINCGLVLAVYSGDKIGLALTRAGLNNREDQSYD